MCGIAFIWDKKNQIRSEEPIQKMVDSLSHRGPDGSNYSSHKFNDSTVYIGHTHLNILSSKKDKQQPFCKDKNLLTYNGAIYNYKELNPIALSDSEALFSSLQSIGINDTLPQLDGMFGFVYLNQDSIYIARDSMGIKPVYYFNDENYLIVSSETKAIFETGLVKRTINNEEAKHFLKYKHTSIGYTLFENIHELIPGNYIETNETSFTEKSFTPVTNPSTNLEETLTKSIQNQLQTKGNKVGLFLSGGIDSTLILSIIRNLHPDKEIVTLSVKVKNTTDSKFSKLASEQFGTTHYNIPIDSVQLNSIFDKNEEPVGDIAAITTHLLSKKAKELGIDVVISGAGADELFAGYNRHLAFDKIHQNKFIPYQWLKFIPFAFNSKLRMLKKLGESIGKTPSETFINFTSTRWDIDVKKEANINSLEKALQYDTSNFLVKDVLTMTDKTCMQNGVECRVPFLGNNVVNFAQSYNKHLEKGTKSLLKSLLIKNEGRQYVEREKEGFGFSIHKDDVDLILSLEKSEQLFNFIDYNEVMRKASLHQQEKDNFSQELVTLLILRNTLI